MSRIVSVTSKNNRVYTDILRLHQRKFREREGRFLVEGENLVGEVLRGAGEILDLAVEEGSRFDPEAGGILPGGADAPAYPGTVYRFSRKLFENAAATETSQGILAVVRKPEQDWEFLRHIDWPGGNLAVLDRLQDPGNIGTILRTAEAAGYEAVLLVRGTADPFSPKAVRAAAGAVFRMPVIPAGSGEEMLDLVRSLGKKLAVTCMDGSSLYYEADLTRNIALVIGNEGNGCDPALIRAADIRVQIPMKGSLESLNASIAAAILMYEAVRGGGSGSLAAGNGGHREG